MVYKTLPPPLVIVILTAYRFWLILFDCTPKTLKKRALKDRVRKTVRSDNSRLLTKFTRCSNCSIYFPVQHVVKGKYCSEACSAQYKKCVICGRYFTEGYNDKICSKICSKKPSDGQNLLRTIYFENDAYQTVCLR